MPTLKLFVTAPNVKGRIVCATLNTLKDTPFSQSDAPAVVDELSDLGTTDKTVQTEEDVAAYFANNGEWHTVVHADELSGTMEEKIETLVYDKEGRRLVARTHAACAAATVSKWTFLADDGTAIPVSFDGFQKLKKAVRDTLSYELRLHYYAGVNDYSAFMLSSTGK